ncbi:MAG: hypothetical protein JXK94_15680 [Deltaproteobacteria bacterium]|nr:hypothetical protein [Deltaproteobacteria bacterium]
MKISRSQNIVEIFTFTFLVFLLVFFPVRVFATEVSFPIVREMETMIGERLEYEIGFLWFDRLAEAYLSFNRGKKDGTFVAVLEAKTLGIAAWLTDYQRQKIVATMEPDGNDKFRTLQYDWLKIKGKAKKGHIWKKSYIFNYKEKKIHYVRFRDGKETARKVFPIKDGELPADVLTTLYNFRRGAFGETMTETPLIVPTFSRQGSSDIKLEIALPRHKSSQKFFSACRPLFRGTVNSEVFDTSGGYVYACLDSQGRPFKGIVENVLGLGDVRGSLKKAQVLALNP